MSTRERPDFRTVDRWAIGLLLEAGVSAGLGCADCPARACAESKQPVRSWISITDVERPRSLVGGIPLRLAGDLGLLGHSGLRLEAGHG
jgi:hypothetical protein